MTLLDWCRVFRLQTLGATAMAPVFGAALVIGFDIRLLYVFFFGVLVHLVGFGHNNFCDRKADPDEHSNPIAREIISEQWAALVLGILWAVMYLFPIFFVETDIVVVFIIVLTMSVSGTLYNILSKRFVLSGVFLGLWICTLTLSGFAFFSLDWNLAIGILCLAAFMQCWCQWIEGLVKDRLTDFVNLARRLRGIRWDVFFWGSAIVQIIVLDLVIWALQPEAVYRRMSFLFITMSLVVWLGIWSQPGRSMMLKLSGLHEILIYEAVVCCLSVFVGEWVILFGVVPVLIYFGFNKLLYGEMGRPKI